MTRLHVHVVILVDSGRIQDAALYQNLEGALNHAAAVARELGWDGTQPWYDWVDETQYDIVVFGRPVSAYNPKEVE